MKKLILVFIFFLLPHSISASNYSCNDLKDFVIKEKFTTPPLKDEVNGFGFLFFGKINDEGNYVYDTEINDGTGITIDRIYNETINENFDVFDTIVSIDNVNLQELFSNFSIQEASLKIDELLEKNNLIFEVQNLDNEIFSVEVLKQMYLAPNEVWIDFVPKDITFVDVKSNTYSAKYYYTTEWKDNRFQNILKNIEDNECQFKRVNENDPLYSSLWSPEIIEENKIDNIDTFDNFQYADIYFYLWGDKNDVYIMMDKHNNATFNMEFNLTEFPFDNQDFQFLLYTPEVNSDIMLNEWYNQDDVESGWKYFLSTIVHPEWNYKDIYSEVYQKEYSDSTYYDNYYLSITAERNISYYITKVIIPIFIILIICWTVFWISGLQLESRLTVTSVSFLALIAYNYVVEEDLPKLGYNTILDHIILCSYIFAGLATILTVYSYTNCKKNNYDFCTVDYLARYVGPIAYIIVNAILIINGIESMTAAQFLGKFT